jgi:uncharacterized protein (DUF1778 family)
MPEVSLRLTSEDLRLIEDAAGQSQNAVAEYIRNTACRAAARAVQHREAPGFSADEELCLLQAVESPPESRDALLELMTWPFSSR